MLTSNIDQPRGVLNPGARKFHLSLHKPAADLAFFVDYYWIVEWDLRGQEPYLSETLPHPCVHLVFGEQQSGIFGVVKGAFSYLLQGEGRVFGIHFKPGAFYPFVKMPVSRFTDTVVAPHTVFGMEYCALEATFFSCSDVVMLIEPLEQFFRQRLPEQDEHIVFINQVIDCIIIEREIARVEDVAKRFHISPRTLQRLFYQYVGVSPKWVIKRYRLHEAAAQVASGAIVDWSKLALDLGYFDQAHFIKEFKTIVGKTPGEYAKLTDSISQSRDNIPIR